MLNLLQYFKNKFFKKKTEEKLYIAAPLSPDAYRMIEKQRQIQDQELQEFRIQMLKRELQGKQSSAVIMNELNNESYQGESFVNYWNRVNSSTISQSHENK